MREKQPRLTPKQEAFCVAYLKSASGSEAYIEAYGRGKMSDSSIRSAVSRLLELPHISQRISELRGEVAKRAVVDTAWVVEKAVEVVKRGLEAEPVRDRKGKVIDGVWTYDAKATVAALSLLAKYTGGFTDKIGRSGSVGVTVVRHTPPLDEESAQ